jgi:membrane associated rhomboid family serine protease
MSFNQYRPSGFGGLPLVTKNIIIINVILFAFTFVLQTQGVDLNDYLGLHYYLAPNFKPHQFITYIFMHANVAHIFFNMFGVFMFGRAIEMAWGPKRFLIFYIVTGLGAAIAQYIIMHFQITEVLTAVNQEIDSITDVALKSDYINQKYDYLNRQVIIGASGSLFGLLGAYGMLFPNQMLYVYFLFPVKAKWLVTAYGAIELFSGLSNSPGDNVAHFAHLGGLFVGIILVLIWRKNRNQYY